MKLCTPLLFLVLAGQAWADYQVLAQDRNVGTTSVLSAGQVVLTSPTTFEPIESVACTISGTAGVSPQVIHIPLIQRTFNFYGVVQFKIGAGSWNTSAPNVNPSTYTPAVYHKYDAYFDVENTTGGQATYTVRWWKTSDPSNDAFAHESVMDLGPGEKTSVHLQELYPFTYDVTASGWNPTEVDGEAIGAWLLNEIAPTGSNDTIVTTEPDEDDVAHEFTPGGATAPAAATPATRATGTVDTIQKADQNATANATDARADAGRVAEAATGTTNAVNALGGTLGGKLDGLSTAIGGVGDKIDALGEGTGGASEFSEDIFEAADGHADGGAAKELYGKMQTVGTDFYQLASVWQISSSGGDYPTFGFGLPSALGGGSVSFDLGEWSTVLAIARLIMLLGLTWAFVVNCIATIRGATA